MSISDNYKRINNEINDTCAICGRKAEDITLLAVSKTRTAEEINEAVRLGIKDIGENKVQELLSKLDSIEKDAVIHFIGQLQNNKVKYIIDKVQLIHSLDRLSLAEEINKRATKHNITVNALVEINTTDIEARGGIMPQHLLSFLEQMQDFANISVRGLMAVAPDTDDVTLQRKCFAQIYKLYTKTKDVLGDKICYLSMGMSSDFKSAIMEGSNIIRIGSALFGSRY